MRFRAGISGEEGALCSWTDLEIARQGFAIVYALLEYIYTTLW
jgi:hypothetical protein